MILNSFHQNPITSSNSKSAPQQYQHHCAGVDHMNQEIKNEISSLETLQKKREDEDKLMAEMIMSGVNHETQRLNQLLGRTNPENNKGTTAAAAPQFGASQNNEMSFPEILRKQREDQDKMMAEMISGATYRQNQQLSHMIAASSLNNQAINHQFNQTLMSYGSSVGDVAAGQGQVPNLYQNTMGAGLFNTGAGFAGLGLNSLFGNLKF